MRRLVAAIIGLTVVFVGTVAAAAWLSTGTADGVVVAASLNAPTSVTGAQRVGSGTVDVTWIGSSGSVTPAGYFVVRAQTGGSPVLACGTSQTSPVSGTSCVDPSVPPGTYTYSVVAVFHNWTRSSAPSGSVAVGKADQVVTITSVPASPTYGGTYVLAATGGGSGNPVVFGTNTPTVCSVSGSTVSFLHAGTCTVTADQAGSTYYNPAPQVTQTIAVAKASQAITFTSAVPANAVVGGPGYSPTATGGGSGNPVSFAIDPLSSSVCSIVGGVVTYEHVGTCVVDAGQAGSADYAAATPVQQSIAVGKGAQAINFTSTAPANARVGGPTYTVTASGGASGNQVAFATTTPVVCTLSGSVVSFVGAGTCTVTANQAGSADYLAATQVQQSFTVTKTDQTITITSTAPSGAAVGQSYAAAATATSGLAVVFGSATSTVCTVSGSTVSFVGAGTCTVTANQPGNSVYNAAAQVQQSFAVTFGGPAITSCTRNVSTGEVTVTWSPFAGATSYRLNLTINGSTSTTSAVTSPATTNSIGKNTSGTVSVVAVTANGNLPGVAWTFDGSGSNQKCHQ